MTDAMTLAEAQRQYQLALEYQRLALEHGVVTAEIIEIDETCINASKAVEVAWLEHLNLSDEGHDVVHTPQGEAIRVRTHVNTESPS